MLLKISLCVSAALLLSSCVLGTPEVDISTPGYYGGRVYDTPTYYSRPAREVWTPAAPARSFCPPGHAKKGWC